MARPVLDEASLATEEELLEQPSSIAMKILNSPIKSMLKTVIGKNPTTDLRYRKSSAHEWRDESRQATLRMRRGGR